MVIRGKILATDVRGASPAVIPLYFSISIYRYDRVSKCYSPASHLRRFGEDCGKGRPVCQAEGGEHRPFRGELTIGSVVG